MSVWAYWDGHDTPRRQLQVEKCQKKATFIVPPLNFEKLGRAGIVPARDTTGYGELGGSKVTPPLWSACAVPALSTGASSKTA